MPAHQLPINNSDGNLTLYEREGLNQRFNLSDGHAHQHPNDRQQKIIAELSQMYWRAEDSMQSELERVQEGCSSGTTPLGILSGCFRGICQPPDHQTNHRETHHTFTTAR